MPPSATSQREFLAHCAAILEVLANAEVPCFAPEDVVSPEATGIAMLPALRAFKVSHYGWKRFRDYLTHEDYLETYGYWHNARGEAFLVLPLPKLFPVLHHSRHPVATAYSFWECQVVAALSQHGYYDPATNHQVPIGQELDAIEAKADFHDILRSCFGDRGWGFFRTDTPEEPEDEPQA
jgi:hypothetical protein